MRTIYVVFGQTGEYSDHVEWPVKAFGSKQMAETVITNLSEAYRVAYANVQPFTYGPEREAAKKTMEALDPQFQYDYTGTSYSYYEVELVD